MSFYGNHFSFNGIPCEKFGLAIYDIGSTSQDDTISIASSGTMLEDWIPSKYQSFFYGVQQNTPLTFTMIFGVDPEKKRKENYPNMDDFLDRWEIAQISNWLTGHKDNRKWLKIEQPDMESVRFLCSITDLKLITYGWHPWAFSCTVTCDSPYGYLHPKNFHFSCEGTKEVSLHSKSTINDFYYPTMKIAPKTNGIISIKNQTDNNREFLFSAIPVSENMEIKVNNDRGIIKCSDDRNLYNYFNFNFFRLLPGNNQIILSGNFELDIICEFPVNIGG